MLASLPALVEKIRVVCQRVLQRVFRAQSTPPTAAPTAPTPSWKDTVKEQFGITSDTPETPPKAPAPAAGAAERAQQQRRSSHDR